jgi:hypothetical protein
MPVLYVMMVMGLHRVIGRERRYLLDSCCVFHITEDRFLSGEFRGRVRVLGSQGSEGQGGGVDLHSWEI